MRFIFYDVTMVYFGRNMRNLGFQNLREFIAKTLEFEQQ